MVESNFITLILFFVYTLGLGFTATSFVRNSNNFLERNIMRIGVGLGVFVFLGVVFNLLRIPIDWKIFLVLSILYPIIYTIKNYKTFKSEKFGIKKSDAYIGVAVLISLFALYMYTTGAFAYDYLEDDDPWAHAESTKYIAVEKTAFEPAHGKITFHYIDPYPPGYNIVMGVLAQTAVSLSWVLKFFNALIISLSLLFFFFFAKSFTAKSGLALFATFVLAALPSYFTHFIWAHTFVIMLMFPALYCLERMKFDKRWMYVGLISVAAIPLTHSSQAIKIGIMLFVYVLVKSIYAKKIQWNYWIAIVGGYLISGLWWFQKASGLFGQTTDKLQRMGLVEETPSFISKVLGFFLPDSGSATRVYNFWDFFQAEKAGMINVQVGWGVFATLLVLAGLVYVGVKYKDQFSSKNSWVAITLLWFLFTFLGTNSMTFNLPVGLFGFRFWLLLAVPAVLIAGLGLEALIKLGRRFAVPGVIIVVVLAFAVAATSGYQKFSHNTNANWPAGAKWSSMDELSGYVWLKTLPPDTKVFKYTKPLFVFGLDKYSCEWCPEVISFRENLIYTNASELHSWLKAHDYQYLAIGGMDLKYMSKEFGENETTELLPVRLQEIQESGLFGVAHQNQGMAVLVV